MLCDDLEGWDREDGREAQEEGCMGTCICIWLIRFVVQQKLTQHCEAFYFVLLLWFNFSSLSITSSCYCNNGHTFFRHTFFGHKLYVSLRVMVLS